MQTVTSGFSLLVIPKLNKTEIYQNELEANKVLEDQYKKGNKDYEGASATKYSKGDIVVNFEFPEDVTKRLYEMGLLEKREG